MYRRVSGILLPVLIVALAAVGIWGYQENQDKNMILVKAENQYQRAFHDLTYHIGKLHDELGKSLAISTKDQISPCLTSIWRLAYAAQSDVGQLPLTLMPFNKTEEFLSKIGDFSYRIAMRDLEKEPLSDKEWSTLQELYKRSNHIQDELQGVQSKIIDNNLRWMDVETALATQDKKMDNTIVDGFRTVDDKVQEYGELNWGTAITSVEQRRDGKLQNIKGTPISQQEAKTAALRFLGMNQKQGINSADIKVQRNGKGSEYNSYSVTVNQGQKNSIQMDVTKNGGHVVWYINEREIEEPKISFQQTRQKALDFLNKHKYQSMEITAANRYEQLAVFTAVHKQGNVLIYPDAVTVKVALDNGEITGFQAEKYLLSHVDRTLNKPKLSEQEARGKLRGQLKVTRTRQAVIENNMGEDVLCYEFLASLGDDTYRIFINASDGKEEEVEVMKNMMQ